MEVNKVMTNFCGSSFWNSSLTWYTKHPDLTICFERTVLLSVPCIYLWIFSCMEIYRISKSQNKFIPWNWRNVAKLLVIMVLCLLTLSEITFTVLFTQHTYGVDIYAALIKLISFVLTFILLIYNRKYGIRSSGMQFIFWLLLALCGIFQLRTEIGNVRMKYLHYYHSYLFYSIYYSLVWLMLLLSSLNDRPPRCDVKKSKKLSPEEESGFISRLMFSWFETLAWKGFRNPLTGSDVYDLKSEDTAKEVVLIFDTEWHKSPSKSNSSKKTGGHTSVLPVILRSFMSSFIFGVILKFSSDLLCFATPQILSLLINFVNEKQEYWKGYFYAVLLFTSETIRSLTFSQYSYKMNVLGLRVKTSLNSAIYRKALKISNKVRRNYTAGEIVNLISSDVKNVVELPTNIIVVMSAVLQVLIALYFLWNILGISVVAGLTVIVILVPINAVISNILKKLQTLRMQCTDGRIKIVNEVLNSIKVLKLYAWEPCFQTKISKIRNEEIGYLKKIVYLNSGTSFIWACAPFMVSLVCFAMFVLIDKENILNAKVAFVSISLFNLLKYPLNLLPVMISNIVQASVSIQRINKLLNAEELNPDNVSHNPKETAPLLIRNGYFSWGEQKILKNINIDIEKKSLTAILGTVGSGKSSLLSAFLGETHKISGYVNTVGTIAYVPQQAWIINATLRDNILFGKSYDRIKYQRVIRACALKSDFEMLPGGDSTEIGEKGINLSGGQKQRISLARAVYSGADIYFLDDPLSAVDTQVGKHIFEKVIGPHGLLSTRTRVFVTHGITYLSQTDKVVVLKNGEISESGTYQELLDKRGDFSEFLMNHINEDSDEFNKEMMYKRKSEISNDSFQHSSISLEKLLLSSQTISQTNLLSHKIVEVEKMETGSVGYEIYKYYLKSIGWFLLMATIVSNLSCHMLTIGCSFWLSLWSTDQDITGNGQADHSKTTFYLIIYSIFGLGKGITTIFAVLAPQLGGCYAAIKLHLMLLKRIIHAPMSFFDVTPIGRILCRFSKDVGVVDNKLAYYLFDGTNSIFMVLGTLVVISYTAPIFIVVIIPIGLIYYLIQKFYVETSRQLKRLEAISRSPIYSFFGESIAGASSIRAFRDESRFTTNFEDRVDVNQACYYLSVVSNRWLAIRLEALGNIVVFFAVIFAVTDKHLNAGLLGLSVTYALEITQTLNYLVRITSEVETNIVSVERLKEYEEAPQEAPWEVVEKTPDSSWPNNGVVVFKNYGVRYRPGLDLVLKDANFKINENEKIGIVGRTGAGKSSLTLSLFRILEAARGGISIDDVNIADLGLHALRSRITIIPQDAVLFSGTVRMNLDPYEQHNDEEIWRTLEHAHLKSFVSGLPDGLSHIAAEGGENFSLGQRQLICLGRALLRKTKVLVLDEATAAVDLETDNLIQRTIRKEFSECTVLTIAHRLNTIMDSDKVIVLDKGTVIEFDSPANLLKTDSIFYRMCKDAGLVQSNL